MSSNDQRYTCLKTGLGDILVRLDRDAAPLSSADFLRHAESGLLARCSFWRSVSPKNDNGNPHISVIQAGPIDTHEALPGIPHEPTTKTGLRHRDGTLSLARSTMGTASGASFFICIGDQPGLDAGIMRNADGQGFAAFGQVIEGMDVVRAIHAGATKEDADSDYIRGQILADPVAITAVEIRG